MSSLLATRLTPMKTMCTTLVLLGLTIGSAAADDTYRSSLSGNVTIEVVPKDADKAPATAKPGENLTIRFVPPPKPDEPEANDVAKKLEACGDKWNKKLKAYDAGARQRDKYLAYYKRWEDYPAQRPPKLAEPPLSRTTYRTCMYACLHDASEGCPGGWASDSDRTSDEKPHASK
jgi:hypothetical protein